MKKNVGQLTSEIYAALEGLSAEESSKVLGSVQILLGFQAFSSNDPIAHAQASVGNQNNPKSNSSGDTRTIGDAKSFFDQKKPQNKGEEFAVAAMYRQLNKLGDVHTSESFKDIIKTQAKRKFDSRNFGHDIQNAIRQANLFLAGDSRGEYSLSSHGENYVNALPDRTSLPQTKKKSPKGGKKTARKKKTTK